MPLLVLLFQCFYMSIQVRLIADVGEEEEEWGLDVCTDSQMNSIVLICRYDASGRLERKPLVAGFRKW